MTRLFDGLAEPDFRGFLAERLARSAEARFAVRRIRLARVDFTAAEWRRVERCRVLIGRIDVDTLDIGGAAFPPLRVAALLELAASGRLEVRSAGLTTWEPDFSVLGLECGAADLAIVGCHRFGAGDPTDGPSFAVATDAPDVVALAARRFDETWRRGYDVLEAVVESLCRLPSGVDPVP